MIRRDAFSVPHLTVLRVQQTWLRAYSLSTGQAYFIIEREGQAIGTMRVYDSYVNCVC